jgi:hypothetical protein
MEHGIAILAVIGTLFLIGTVSIIISLFEINDQEAFVMEESNGLIVNNQSYIDEEGDSVVDMVLEDDPTLLVNIDHDFYTEDL